MNSPTIALAWEIWQRGRRFAWLVLGIVFLCALVNLGILNKFHITQSICESFTPFFGLLMTVSFLLLMGIFNYTEFNSSKEWNGFPYRLFVVPVPTWKLVALPIYLAVISAELIYVAWIKFIWTHSQIPAPEWFAVVLGAYVIFYQTTLWTLAGLRITRMIALSFGGVSSIIVAFLPFLTKEVQSPWLTEQRLIPLVIGLAIFAFVIAWVTVARQRCGGGQRRSWIKIFFGRISDVMPRRTTDFSSPAAAQFWIEWRRTGWLLPVCTGFLLAIIALGSWFTRDDPNFTNYLLTRLLLTPVCLAFVIGKGFIKCEFWSTNLSFPTFIATKPFFSGEFVISKMKVAAVSVVLTWILVLGFIALWLPLWANTEHLKPIFFQLRMFFPHSWQIILVFSVVASMVLTWRSMVGGLWVGLSGRALYYFGSLGLQVIVPTLVLLAGAIGSDAIDAAMDKNPVRFNSIVLSLIGWFLAIGIIAKVWVAVFSWDKLTSRRTLQYQLIWLGITLAFVSFAILASPPLDVYRIAHLLVLGALFIFPLARIGFAPLSLAKNRHR